MFDIITDSFLFDLYYGGKSASEVLEDGDTPSTEKTIPPVTEETPAFRNIYVKNLVSRNARRAMFFNGLPEMNITNINVENAIITAKLGAELCESANIHFNNVKIIPQEGPALILKNVKDMQLKDFAFPDSLSITISIEGKETKNISWPENISKEKVNIQNDVNPSEIINHSSQQ